MRTHPAPEPVPWVLLDTATDQLRCRRCGAAQQLARPLTASGAIAACDLFLATHAGCLRGAERAPAPAEQLALA